MASEAHRRALERMYLSAPCNAYFKPRITIGDGACEIGIPVREDLFHAAHALHGAVSFKAMDDAAFFAASSVVDDMFIVTVSFNVTFHRPVTKGELVCHGKVVQATKQLVFADAVVTDSDGRTIARGNGTFVRSSIPLSRDLGYEPAAIT